MMQKFWFEKMKINETFFVFDMDDTLYKEIDFYYSGVSAVVKYVERNFGVSLDKTKSWEFQTNRDVLNDICSAFSLPLKLKEQLLWIYRLHHPRISLHSDAKIVIDTLIKKSCGVAILTDGRSITQRNKQIALGLSHIPIFISEEWGSSKPDKCRFVYIEKTFSATNYVYIGDNPQKDFVAPNSMGWKTIGLRGDNKNIHSQDTASFEQTYHPTLWINKLIELFDYYDT